MLLILGRRAPPRLDGAPRDRWRGTGSLGPMAPLTPEQVRRREQVESLIRVIAPALNLVLAAGERISRIVGSEDHEYHPPQQRQGGETPPR